MRPHGLRATGPLSRPLSRRRLAGAAACGLSGIALVACGTGSAGGDLRGPGGVAGTASTTAPPSAGQSGQSAQSGESGHLVVLDPDRSTAPRSGPRCLIPTPGTHLNGVKLPDSCWIIAGVPSSCRQPMPATEGADPAAPVTQVPATACRTGEIP